MNKYHFITHWRVEATCQEVYNTLKEADDLKRWWPSVYLDVKTHKKGDTHGLGKIVELYTKGFLPYTLKWQFEVTDVQPNTYSGFSLRAFGDFVGRGIWTFEQDGKFCEITYDWELEAEKPILKYLSFLMKPLFSSNHHWAMRKGQESLKLELRRRNGESNVAPPPPPTFPHNILNNNIL
ncbi:MAG: SRPBCC family protein [Saprospiraceae bacterium]|nr:SRPBCC family protein [Saprospiraceae bacterium]